MHNNKQPQVVLLTGGSSGIGFDTAQALAKQGYIVYAAARRVDLMQPLTEQGIHVLKMDVCDEASMQQGVHTVLEEQGRVDVLINNAGYGYLGAIENVTMAEAKRQLEVNVFGLARLCQLVLPTMRRQGRGRIINISSIAGRTVMAYGGWYNVSKYAVEALSDALRIELKPFGIDVVLIEPGPIKTDWGLIAADHLSECSKGTVYEPTADSEARLLQTVYRSDMLSEANVVCKAICRAVNARRPRLRYLAGRGSSTTVLFHALLPARWWDALNRFAVRLNLNKNEQQ